jgi:hypothetical protein
MRIVLTPEARDYIYSQVADRATLNLIGQAINFELTIDFKQNVALAKIHPNVKPVIYLNNGNLGLQHVVAENKVMFHGTPRGQTVRQSAAETT